MNKLYNIFVILLSSCFFLLNSCDEGEDVKIVLDSVMDGMQLTPRATDIALSQSKMDDLAITFKWNPAQTRKNNGTLTYYFKLGLPGFTKAIDKITIAQGVGEYSISNNDLNTLIHDKLGVNYGNTVQLQAEVVAWSDGDYFVKPEISTVLFNVTTFKP